MIGGTIPALLTPFRDSGRAVDFDAMDAVHLGAAHGSSALRTTSSRPSWPLGEP